MRESRKLYKNHMTLVGKDWSKTASRTEVTTWSLEKKNVVPDGLGDFLGTELKPAVQFQEGFSLKPLEIHRNASFDQIL